MPDQRNLMLAIALSVAILFGFQFLYEMPRQEARQSLASQFNLFPDPVVAGMVGHVPRPRHAWSLGITQRFAEAGQGVATISIVDAWALLQRRAS